MRLFLPWKGWHVCFQQDLQEYDDLFHELEPVNTNILEDPPEEAVLTGDYDIRRLLGRPEVCWIREAWYWTNYDGIEFPEDELGHLRDTCMGQALLYHDYEQILDALAKVHEPTQWLLTVNRSGPPSARSLARVILDGDRSGLPILADALEEAGHALAPQVRKTANAKAKRSTPAWNLSGKGPPLPSLTDTTPADKEEGNKDAGKKASRKRAASKPSRVAEKEPARSVQVKSGAAQEVVLIGGYPCGGKTGLASTLTGQGYARLNRDDQGGTLADLLPLLTERLRGGQSVVLDNLYATRESRSGVLQAAREAGMPVRFLLLDTSLEDAQFNACLRMIEKCGRVLHPEDHKKAPYKGDPSLYPVAVLYKYRNDFEEPTPAEGFASIEKVKFVRRYPPEWINKAVIFDFDGTLRSHEGREKFPIHPSEVRAFRPRAEVIRRYAAQGYLLLGASNQSGVAKGTVSAADVEACFAETLRQLGVAFTQVLYCPHKVPPISCYCRKPGPGMGVELIVRHRLDPRQCTYVGDAGTDRSFAQRCGVTFVDQAEFFKA